ncbi:MAG: FAD binding domain-containing protein, partial [Crocinitomicaceae bacterium]|nr:FAD binding domain-containing protein [Crocinitomicaceae bacterium]
VTYEDVISGIDGNICRCTGYKSIERAARIIYMNLKNKDLCNPVDWLVANNYIPAYFNSISSRLKELALSTLEKGKINVGGGTDLYVQKHDEMEEASVQFISDNQELRNIEFRDGRCYVGAAVTPSMLMEKNELMKIIPGLWKFLKLVSSTPVRNIGTVGGNFVNASPIGDLTAFFIALNSSIVLRNDAGKERTMLLKDFYKGYKTLDKKADEQITCVHFEMPGNKAHFNFEKLSKRTYLDIASVNSAALINLNGEIIEEIYVSAGGVGPIPVFLKETCAFLKGKKLTTENLDCALEIVQSEISPISDARGTIEYKRLLLRQLFFAHFVELFPEKFNQPMVS